MTRFITIILLLLVFFFGGMSYGSFEKNRHTTESAPVILEEQTIEHNESIEIVESVINESQPFISEDNKIHRTATFFEEIVTTVYEVIIKVMYSIASLFFD